MRHQKNKKILGRLKQPREMMLRNLAASIIMYEKVKTTEAKAKAVKSMLERFITISKKNDLISRRRLLADLPQKLAVKKMMEVINKRYQNRSSGYVRIIRLGNRQGDGAKIVQIELV